MASMNDNDKYPNTQETLKLTDAEYDDMFEDGSKKIATTFPPLSDEEREEYVKIAKEWSKQTGIDMFDKDGNLLIDSNPKALLTQNANKPKM